MNKVHAFAAISQSLDNPVEGIINTIRTQITRPIANYFNADEYRYFANLSWFDQASTGQKLFGTSLAAATVAAAPAAAIAGGAKVAAAALLLAGASFLLGACGARTGLEVQDTRPNPFDSSDALVIDASDVQTDTSDTSAIDTPDDDIPDSGCNPYAGRFQTVIAARASSGIGFFGVGGNQGEYLCYSRQNVFMGTRRTFPDYRIFNRTRNTEVILPLSHVQSDLCSISDNGRYVIAIENSGTLPSVTNNSLYLYDLQNRDNPSRTLISNNVNNMGAILLPAGNSLFYISEGSMYRYDIQTRARTELINTQQFEYHTFSVNETGETILFSAVRGVGQDQQLYRLDVASRRIDNLDSRLGNYDQIFVSRDGRRAIYNYWRTNEPVAGNARMYLWENGQPIGAPIFNGPLSNGTYTYYTTIVDANADLSRILIVTSNPNIVSPIDQSIPELALLQRESANPTHYHLITSNICPGRFGAGASDARLSRDGNLGFGVFYYNFTGLGTSAYPQPLVQFSLSTFLH